MFPGELTDGPQLEPAALLEFELELELTRVVWRALPDDVEA
jgi:hypothetical protein